MYSIKVIIVVCERSTKSYTYVKVHIILRDTEMIVYFFCSLSLSTVLEHYDQNMSFKDMKSKYIIRLTEFHTKTVTLVCIQLVIYGITYLNSEDPVSQICNVIHVFHIIPFVQRIIVIFQ